MAALHDRWPHQWFGWCSDAGFAQTQVPTYQEMVDLGWKVEDLPQILNYLLVVPAYLVTPQDRLHCPDCGLYLPYRGTMIWDNEWLWPQNLAHEVEMHSVRLPTRFIDHIRARKYNPPPSGAYDTAKAESVNAALSDLLLAAARK